MNTGWVLRDVSGGGFAVDDPIEGSIFTVILNHADVWETKEKAEAAGKRRKYVGVTAVEVRLDPKGHKARAVELIPTKSYIKEMEEIHDTRK